MDKTELYKAYNAFMQGPGFFERLLFWRNLDSYWEEFLTSLSVYNSELEARTDKEVYYRGERLYSKEEITEAMYKYYQFLLPEAICKLERDIIQSKSQSIAHSHYSLKEWACKQI